MRFNSDPILLTLKFLGKKWNYEILNLLFFRDLKFSEIQEAIPEISNKVLSEKIKVLYENGFVNKVISSFTPLDFTYRITKKAKTIAKIFIQLGIFGCKLFPNQVFSGERPSITQIENYYYNLYQTQDEML